MIGGADWATLRAAWWAQRAARQLVRSLAAAGLDAVPLPPPYLPAHARRGAAGALRRTRATCLVRAKVMQAWDAAHGRSRDLVVGVTAPSRGFRAHAWLDGDPPCHSEGFQELLRLPPSEPAPCGAGVVA